MLNYTWKHIVNLTYHLRFYGKSVWLNLTYMHVCFLSLCRQVQSSTKEPQYT